MWMATSFPSLHRFHRPRRCDAPSSSYICSIYHKRQTRVSFGGKTVAQMPTVHIVDSSPRPRSHTCISCTYLGLELNGSNILLLLRVSSVPMLLQYEWNCESIPNPSADGVSLPDNMSSREKRHTKVGYPKFTLT